MQHQEYLIPGGEAGLKPTANRSAREVWRRKVAARGSKFLARSSGGAGSSSSRLLENFSEFLATRNVINSNSSNDNNSIIATNATGHYDRLVSPAGDSSLNLAVAGEQPKQFYGKTTKAISSKKRTYGHARHRPQHRTISLLFALVSPKSKSRRASILMNLMRAPTVLAALFSLLLVVTLIVLYALSFRHHQAPPPPAANSSWSSRLISPPSKETSPRISHRISSRDLPAELKQPTEDITSDADDQDDNEEENQNDEERADEQLPEGLSRALSVQTECGLFVGSAEDNGVIFRGIPFASPPVGQRRWQRPQPIWLDTQRCNVSSAAWADRAPAGSARAQTRTIRGGRRDRRQAKKRPRGRQRHCAQLSPITNRFAGQEDCLYLDIYLPRLDQSKKLPVMVYIHGGFLAFGGSSFGQPNWTRARPSARLAAELDVIVVAFNYRLQALGFMTLPQLATGSLSAGPSLSQSQPPPSSSPSPSSGAGDQAGGNFGLWDQLTALNWIKRNIESFGGDSNNIVLFGPDSASSLVWALIGHQRRAASPAAAQNLAPTELRNLFRAAWLTNPTIFYDLPYELAGQHYQRLFQNQSACLLELDSSGSRKSPAHQNETTTTTAASSTKHTEGGEPKSTQLKDCLLQLGAEQVMRHYLGNDHPSYRLDDQNSLPIHGIFVDQFVTIDRELVRDSFPFGRGANSGPDSVATFGEGDSTNTGQRCNSTAAAAAAATAANSETNLPKSSQSSLQPPPPQPHGGANRNETGSPHYADDSMEANAGQTNEIGADCGHEDDSSMHPSPPSARWPLPLQESKPTIDLLIGSTAQAVEYWPCPRNINQWTWGDFKRYVATSLNSFSTDLYRRASSLYEVPKWPYKTNTGKQLQHPSAGSPAKTYLTMVSDIRQICPINELADNLRLANGLSVRRYIVESAPAEPPSSVSTKEADELTNVEARSSDGHANNNGHRADLADDQPPSGRPKFAYHTKDLAAFFGYEFDPTFRPQTGDLIFQAKIRQMVRTFVHKQPAGIGDATDNGQIAILDANGAFRYADKYRDTECSMWRRQLGKSYAWTS